MNSPSPTLIFRIVLIVFILIAIDFYAFKGVKVSISGLESTKLRMGITFAYWFITGLFLVLIGYTILNFDRFRGPSRNYTGFLMGTFILLYVPKLMLVIVLLLEDMTRLLRAGGVGIGRLVSNSFSSTPIFEERRKFISQLGLAAAAIPFLSILYGIKRGKYRYRVHRATVRFKDLPEAFDGLKITQLSDIHAGSFDDAAAVQRGIDLVNAQQSDIIFFTGDLVNNRSDEMDAWMGHFSQLKAPLGVYSILGNHDYGDYTSWESPELKDKNLERMKQIHKELGFRLLLNENTLIEKNGQALSLIGMENWGNGNFAKYGDLEKSLKGVQDNAFKILLSHDPSHWDAQTLHHQQLIHLTFAGHTHGMQFGVEVAGLKWSPVKYRYPRWAGLYAENNRYLYVNRGFGFLGFPGRVGIWPEITVITLERDKA